MLCLFLMHGGEIRVFADHYGASDDAVDVACDLVVARDIVAEIIHESCPVFLFPAMLIPDYELNRKPYMVAFGQRPQSCFDGVAQNVSFN